MRFDKQALANSAISIAISSVIVFGNETLQTFGAVMIGITTILAVLVLLSGNMGSELASRIIEQAPINTALSLYQLAALLVAGYAVLGAFYFVVTALLVAAAYNEKKKEVEQ